jgi:hypothetical protein
VRHPAAQIRTPVIEQTANTWRASGGSLPPVFQPGPEAASTARGAAAWATEARTDVTRVTG